MSLAGWSYFNPVRVHFGDGVRAKLADLLSEKRVLVVTTVRGRRQFEADATLQAAGAVLTWVDNVKPNPGLADTQETIDAFREEAFDAVVAFGGGSAMDSAKAIAAGLSRDGRNARLAEIIAEPARYLAHGTLPIYAVPTTAGTGSEVTPFATIWNHARRAKLSLNHPSLFPAFAIVDPELTKGVPLESTLSTGLDAMNQAFESVWNKNATPISLMMAARAISSSLAALPRLHADLNDRDARALAAEASLLAGVCISQTRTAICHSISYPLTAHYGVDHGYACAVTMGAAARMVLEQAPDCLETVARMMKLANAEALIAALDKCLESLGVMSTVRAQLPSADEVVELKGEMYTPGRSDNFILPVDHELIAKIVRASLV